MAVRRLNNNLNVIGDNLRTHRKRAKLSQAGLARSLNLLGIQAHKNDICAIEANKRTVKDYELWAFVKVLGISFEDLFENIDVKIDVGN